MISAQITQPSFGSGGSGGSGVPYAVVKTATTGADPITLVPDPNSPLTVYNITTGGTGGEEKIILPAFTLDDNGMAIAQDGIRIAVYIQNYTEGDTPTFYLYDTTAENQLEVVDGIGQQLGTLAPAGTPFVRKVPLDFAGAGLTLQWFGPFWTVYDPYDNTDAVFTQNFAYFDFYVAPSSDPGIAGALWNNNGVPTFSAG